MDRKKGERLPGRAERGFPPSAVKAHDSRSVARCGAAAGQGAAPSLPAKVAFLSRPESHAGVVGEVEAIETHMAWVFLAGERAYKLKKPVRHPFLDYSTLEARRRICDEEVRRNRRLAPDTYPGCVPLVNAPDGALRIGGSGTPVEWLIEMRRLPRERMLDHAIAARTVTPSDLLPAASLIAEFFARADREPIEPARYMRHLREQVTDNRDALRPQPLAPGDQEIARRLADVLTAFLAENPEVVGAGAREGQITEGHGDLRPEHVYLGPPPAVIDCIEFSRPFRVLDPADELAFLALELQRLQVHALAGVFVQAYVTATNDAVPAPLLHFYAAHRGLLRAKLAIAHLADADADRQRWVRSCRAYLCLAAGHAECLSAPRGASRGAFP